MTESFPRESGSGGTLSLRGRHEETTADHLKWLLLPLPVLVTAANAGWLYNGLGNIDPWIYSGFFQFLAEFKSSLFPNTYYGSRLPWILPGYLAHRLSDPVAAEYVLHFSFYYIAIFSMYALLKRDFGRKNALLGSVAFGTHSAVLRSIGWDYVDGAGLTYCLLALACISRAAAARRPRWWLVAAGMAGIAMVYTNLFLVVFLPFQGAFYLFLTGTGFNDGLVRSLKEMKSYANGAILLSVALGAINYFLDGNFWFYAPSIAALRYLSSLPGQSRIGGLAWVAGAYWLAVPAAVALAAIVDLIRRPQKRIVNWGDCRTFFLWQYLASVALMLAWYAAGGIGLELSYYVSYLLPSMFLAAGAILAGAKEEWKPWVWWPVLLGSVVALTVSLRLYGSPLSQRVQAQGLLTVFACVAAAFTIRALFPGRRAAVAFPMAGLALYQVAYAALLYTPTDSQATQRVIQGVRASWPYIQKQRAVFWYDLMEPFGWEFNAITSSYLGGFSFVSQKFPSLTDEHPLRAGETALVLSGSADVLGQANRTLAQQLLVGSLAATHQITSGPVTYNLSVLAIKDYLPNLRTLKAVRHDTRVELIPAGPGDDPQLPLQGWKGTTMEQRPEGLVVTTGGEQFAYGSWYGPLFAPRSGKYRFTLTYRLLEGRILYGGMSVDMTRGLGRAFMPLETGVSQVVAYTAPLKSGEGLMLLIANDATRPNAPARYLVESLSASATFDDDAQ
jgi:Dolichyl-phosphate-mannose-protein mannosyltransferase